MIPKFDDYQDSYGADLLCPACGFTYLHHTSVEIFERSEDAENGVHITVEGGKATVDNSLKGNPSSRRHGLRIRFSCEGCEATPVLTIKQHKGKTAVDFL